jgi:tRNA modification GTPase
MLLDDTIAAISSATGPAPRMILRLSGPSALQITQTLTPISNPTPNSAHRVTLYLANLSTPASLFIFLHPKSYTAQDLIEFHIPGNPLLAKLLLDHIIAAGARLADPGEFTARAFFAGKLDLSQAEGVAAAIGAQTEDQLAAARQLMAGELSRRLAPIMESLAQTLSLVEAGIDFSEEDIHFIDASQLGQSVLEILGQLGDLRDKSAQFESMSRQPTIVLTGRPNAGKSTLLNALSLQPRSIVSDHPGTTRDILSAEVTLPRGKIKILDVAGLEDQAAAPDTTQPRAANSSRALGSSPPPPARGEHRRTVLRGRAGEGADAPLRESAATPAHPSPVPPLAQVEQQMRSQALRALEEADAVVLVIDVTDQRPPLRLLRAPNLIVASKSDLLAGAPNSPHPAHSALPISALPISALPISALTGSNLDALRTHLDTLAFATDSPGNTLVLTSRHRHCIDNAAAFLAHLVNGDTFAPELAAAELRSALDALGQILGQVTPDDILGKVFATFCIGK